MSELQEQTPDVKQKLDEHINKAAADAERHILTFSREHEKVFERLQSLNMRVTGYILIGSAVGIVTVLQYLLRLDGGDISATIAFLSMIILALSVTSSSVALVKWHNEMTHQNDIVWRASMSMIGMYAWLSKPITEKSSEDMKKEMDRVMNYVLDLSRTMADLISASKPARTSAFHVWLRRAAFLFIAGLWTGLLAATEHLWHWSQHLAKLAQ